jgi:hypothetical protein
MRASVASLALALLAVAATAQEPPDQRKLRIRVDAVTRQEWTRDLPADSSGDTNQERWLGHVLPRLEADFGWVALGVGGEFNWSKDKNTDPMPSLMRDNYKSREARLDLAYGRLVPASWVRLEGGRFRMPVPLTEMIWDRDLRPQGGAVTLQTTDRGALERLALTGLWAQGSHVFDDQKVQMFMGGVDTVLKVGETSRLQLTGSFLKWTRLDGLEPMLRRQNSREEGGPDPAALAHDYQVVDLTARLRFEGGSTTQIVADYCWNTSVQQQNRGLWLALLLGSTTTAAGALEYTYARVDKDATLGAYAGDDFFWATGWEGHRGELAVRTSDRTTMHAIAQLQRPKDDPEGEYRDHWLKRYRLEVRIAY